MLCRAAIRRCISVTTMACACCAGGLASAQDITSNLRGLWKLTETSGTTAVDSSSVPHNGTYTNGVLLANSTAVPVDGAISAKFDGTNDYIPIGTESWFDITGVITVAAWINVNTWSVANQAIMTKGDSAWQLARDGTNSGVRFTCTGLSTNSLASVTAVNDGKWHHVVGVNTGTQLRIYIDGQLDASVSTSGTISQNNYQVEIGRNAETANRWFNGAIYDARVYNRALTAADVAYLCLQGGPVGYWKLNQSSGTTATDSSIYGKNGTVSPSATWSTRCNGTGVFDFNGSTQYVSMTSAVNLQPTAALTIAGWIRSDAWGAGTDNDTILRKGDANPNNYALAVSDGRVELLLDGNDGSGFRGNTVLSTGQWYHVAATWDGATVRVYVNGVLDNTPASKSGAIASDARALYIGGRSGADLLDGLIQEVYLYNRALSQAEIAKLAGLPGQWKFSEGTGATAADTSGSGNNATLSGGATWTTDCAGNNALLTNGTGGIAATNAAFDPPSAGTVSFWMQPASGTGIRRIFGNGGDWEVRQLADGTVVFDICADGGTNVVSTTIPLDQVGRWYHVAISYDSANDSFAIYVDGALHRAGTNTLNMIKQPAAVLSFGTRTGAVEYWPGALRDFRVYNRQLCATEVAAIAGLAAYWKLDETTGTTANDSSPWGRNGTVTGTATWTAGKLNNCLQLDGSTYVTSTGLVNNPKNVTIMSWANLTAAGSGGAEVISLGDCFTIRLNEGTQSRAIFYNGSTWQGAAVSQTFTGSGWRHFAAVFDDDNDILRFYINGTQVSSLSTASSISYAGLGANVLLGRHGNGQTTYNFTGKLDDVRIYSRALCPAQIQEIINDAGGAYQGVRILQWVETR